MVTNRHFVKEPGVQEVRTLLTQKHEDLVDGFMDAEVKKEAASSTPTTPVKIYVRICISRNKYKLDLPKFNEDLLQWQLLWDQFYLLTFKDKSLDDIERMQHLINCMAEPKA